MDNTTEKRRATYESIDDLAHRNFLNGYIELRGVRITQHQFEELKILINTRKFYIIMDTKLCTDGMEFVENDDESDLKF